MHSNGTSASETFSIIIPSFFYTILTTVIITILRFYGLKRQKTQFFIEFITLVIPIILNVTILASKTLELLVTAFMMCVTILLLIPKLGICSHKISVSNNQTQKSPITNLRSAINVISVVAILAVDFRVFPRRFAKTENFGYSLMDVGVGLFVFSNGIVDGGKINLSKSLKGCLPLLVLGLVRFFITKETDYHVPVSEYGVHWNFFITLAVCKIFVSLIFTVFKMEYLWINATLLMISHEVLLESGLKNYVIMNVKRDNFISANREGIVSSLGYASLYLYSSYFGYLLNLKGNTRFFKKVLLKFVVLIIFSLGLTIVLGNFFNVSRKLVNSAYCFWILFIGIFVLGLFYVAEKVLEKFVKDKLGICVFSPFIFEAINYNGLGFFLLANILTGLVNLSCNTLEIGSLLSVIIISTYMLVNCAVICILYHKKIKFKL